MDSYSNDLYPDRQIPDNLEKRINMVSAAIAALIFILIAIPIVIYGNLLALIIPGFLSWWSWKIAWAYIARWKCPFFEESILGTEETSRHDGTVTVFTHRTSYRTPRNEMDHATLKHYISCRLTRQRFETWIAISLLIGAIVLVVHTCRASSEQDDAIDQGAGSIEELKDADGNVYKTVVIGNQEWTIQNLRATKYNDGTPIPHVRDSGEWAGRSTPAYCWYDNSDNPTEHEKWGALYNWHVVSPANPRHIAPDGWRVPTAADWDILRDYLIAKGYNPDGTQLGNQIAKAMAAETDWASSFILFYTPGDIPLSNNRSGFSGLPGGLRTGDGIFEDRRAVAAWWSATEATSSNAWRRYLVTSSKSLNGADSSSSSKRSGLAIRLLRDHPGAHPASAP
mgnify:CR=1 FL=1